MDDELAKELEQLEEDSTQTDGTEDEQTESNSEPEVEEPTIEVDGEILTRKDIKELKAAGLRFDDYTRKTQRVAEERRKLSEESERAKDLREAEIRELNEWRRIDHIISNDPNRLAQFRSMMQGANLQSPQANTQQPQVPEELLRQIEDLQAKEEDRQLEREMSEVKELVGELNTTDEDDFLKFVEKKQEEVQGVLRLSDVALMYAPFRDKLLERKMKTLEADRKKRDQSKAKTKEVAKGKKPTQKGGKSSEDEFLADIQRALGKE